MSLIERVRERGPLTVAAFMDLALYDPELGYYARAPRRSGRGGDFFTSVDVGPLFGELVELQIAEMARLLSGGDEGGDRPVDLVEAGAGSGRLSADILRTARARHPDLYARLHLHLVEASAEARRAHRATLGETADRLASSGPALPTSFEGVLLANELLDALPTHQVVMRAGGLREVFVAVHAGRLAAVEGPPSTPDLEAHLAASGIVLEPGWRVEINLGAVRWMREAARALRRGFVVLIDYGHEAGELYSVTHAQGTLTTYSRHAASGSEASGPVPAWLERPGEQDITAHVDFTGVRRAAEAEGLATLGFLDQTYFLMGLLTGGGDSLPADRARPLRMLLMPGGLGSTMKVLLLGRDVGAPRLLGCSVQGSRHVSPPLRHALVLAAGLGTRLDPLTRVRAKAAVPVAGVPLARRTVAWLAGQGLTDLVMNLHHRPATVTRTLGDGADLGARLRYSWEQPVILGSAGGPRLALDLIGAETFAIVNGDTLTSVDLQALAAAHRASGALVTLALVPNPDPRKYNGVRIDGDGRVVGFVPRGAAAAGTLHLVGVQVASADAFRGLPAGQPAESIRGVYDALMAGRPGAIRGVVCGATFHDIGTVADYWETSWALMGDEREGRWRGRGTSISPSARVTRSILWEGVEVGDGAVLDACIVTDGVRVPAGSRFERTILLTEDGRLDAIPFAGMLARVD